MATSTSPLPELRPAQAGPRRLRRQAGRKPHGAAWTLRAKRLYPRGGMVDVAVSELGAVITLIWPPD